MIRSWRVDTLCQTLVLITKFDALPQCVYWGKRLPDDQDLEQLGAMHSPDVTGGMFDEPVRLTICPLPVDGFLGQPGVMLSDDLGCDIYPDFRLSDAQQNPDGTLSIVAIDANMCVEYQADFKPLHNCGLIVLKSRLHSKRPVRLHWLSAPVLPVSPRVRQIDDFHGRWCKELQASSTTLGSAIYTRESRAGRHGHDFFPAVLLKDDGATHTAGNIWAAHYGWSGATRIMVEPRIEGHCQLQCAHALNSEQGLGQDFVSADAYIAYSDAGKNDIARQFQTYVRKSMPPSVRRVHYNCWEAIYFDHDHATLCDLADRAAKVGAERFVLDDGWFLDRTDDTRALGDWLVDPKKYKQGLDHFINHVLDLGMDFGLWLEPEMINANSALYRAHPNWILGPIGQPLWRNQYALNLALQPVQDHIIVTISQLLERYDISYLKWDHNRALPHPDAANARGLHRILAALRDKFPDVEIESCASGGGRMDYGMLQYCARLWLSDSNDAIERWRIQRQSSVFFPAMVSGAHVGPRVCHTTGRTLPMKFRAWVAASRHMGFEMDLRELDGPEEQYLQDITKWWKQNRDWLMDATIFGLDGADTPLQSELHLSDDQTQFVVFAGVLDTSAQITAPPLYLTQLDAAADYEIHVVTHGDLSRQSRGDCLLAKPKFTISGFGAMHHGLAMPVMQPASMMVLSGKKL